MVSIVTCLVQSKTYDINDRARYSAIAPKFNHEESLILREHKLSETDTTCEKEGPRVSRLIA